MDEETKQRVLTAGAERGKAAGSWVVDGNTSTERCEAILQAFEDCEWDEWPSWLSGEWAGESIVEIAQDLGVDPDEESWQEIYEAAATESYEQEVMRSARAQLGDDADPYYKHPEDEVA